jgi:ribosomal protein S6--L-glutamate ligase
MKAAIISLGSKSSIKVAEAMKKYFKSVDVIQLRDIEVNLGKDGGIFYGGTPLPDYDCIYLKGSFRYANLLRSIATLLESRQNKPFMPLPANAFTIVHNKLLTHLVLQQHNIPMPKTYVSATDEAAKTLLKKIHYPIVMKFPQGTQGKGVMFADSISSASSLLDALGALNQPFIIQEYVETGGEDIRALVVGEKVVASMKRKSNDDEKRANLHSGGKAIPVQLSRETMNIALDTAKALKADICGVDILDGPLGPVVIEANISPGLQGISEVSTLDIPDEIARFLARKTKEVLSKSRKIASNEVMKNLSLDSNIGQQVITDLKFRGERILLPDWVTKMTGFDERRDYTVKAKKGKLEVEEFKI